MMKLKNSVAGMTVLALLCGCNGTSVPEMPATARLPAASSQARQVTSSATFSIRIPRQKTRYVSPFTKSVVIKVDGKKLATFNVTPASSGCKAVNGATQCTFFVKVPVGKDIFNVAAYSGKNGTGNQLSTGTVPQKVAAGLPAVIVVTMSGVVHSIAVTLGNPNLPAGTSGQTPVYVTAYDALGAAIVGPGNYSVPVTVTDNDTSGATTLSSTTARGPDAALTLSYSGHSLTTASIGASAHGVTTVTPASFVPTPTVVSDFVVPLGTGGNSQGTEAITTGPDGNIWFSVYSNPYAIVKMTTAGVMTTYTTGVPSGNTISGLVSGSDLNVWYVDAGSVGKIVPASGAVTDYPLASSGICASPSGTRIVNAADGGFWVAVQCTGSTTPGQLVHVGTNGTFTASTLTGFAIDANPTSNYYVSGLVVGKDGNVYVTGSDLATNLDAIAQVPVSGTTASTPSIIDVPGTLNKNDLDGIAQSADGDLWATENTCTSFLVRVHLASPFTASNLAKFDTTVGCAYPTFLKALPDGTLWVPIWDYPMALQVTPGAYPAAPVQRYIPFPGPPGVFSENWDVTLGPDGDLYFTDDDTGTNNVSSDDIVKLAY